MYTLLNQRYGLKPLTLDAATSFISAIKTYASTERDVSLFA